LNRPCGGFPNRIILLCSSRWPQVKRTGGSAREFFSRDTGHTKTLWCKSAASSLSWNGMAEALAQTCRSCALSIVAYLKQTKNWFKHHGGHLERGKGKHFSSGGSA
jgi:hypothetical protein